MCETSGTLAVIAVTRWFLLWRSVSHCRQSLGVSLESLRSLDTALSGTTHDTRTHRGRGTAEPALTSTRSSRCSCSAWPVAAVARRSRGSDAPFRLRRRLATHAPARPQYRSSDHTTDEHRHAHGLMSASWDSVHATTAGHITSTSQTTDHSHKSTHKHTSAAGCSDYRSVSAAQSARRTAATSPVASCVLT